jgi:hypothetical protein
MTASYIGGALVVTGRVQNKAHRGLVKIGGGPCREMSLGVFVLAVSVVSSAESRAAAQLSTCQLQAGRPGCELGCLCALAPHGAGDCLPRHDPQSIALFFVASGWFRSQNRHCSWRPGAKRAKGGERRQKPDLSYIPATYFVSASV